jgi:type I restriction enzyme, R subunit
MAPQIGLEQWQTGGNREGRLWPRRVTVSTGRIEDENVPLSRVVDVLNQRFGTDFGASDELLWDQVRADLFADETVRDAGQVNPRDNFAYVFDPKFEELVMNRMDRNNDQVVKFLEDPQLKSFITSRFRNQIYDRIQAETKSRILQT